MSRTVGTFEIGLDTPIHLLTPRQLFEMQEGFFKERDAGNGAAERKDEGRWLVNSMDELADVLGTSKSTVYRMKSGGLLDEAISQWGKWMVIDVNAVIEKFRLSNRGRTKTKRGVPREAVL